MTRLLTASSRRALLARLSPEGRAELAERLRRLQVGDRRAGDWLVRHGVSDPAFRLFCISHAGGGASTFRSWCDRLPEEVEVCAVQLPGRESRASEPPYRRLRPLVADLLSAVLPFLDRPYALFGHSMGALLAFELARELRRTGAQQPEHLFLAAFRAPQLPNPNTQIHHMHDDVLKAVMARDGTPRSVLDNDEIMRGLLPMLRADLEICDTYEYSAEAALPIPMAVFGGLHDVRVGRDDLEPWSDQTEKEFSLCMLPGTHFFIRDARDLFLEQLTTQLCRIATLKEDAPA